MAQGTEDTLPMGTLLYRRMGWRQDSPSLNQEQRTSHPWWVGHRAATVPSTACPAQHHFITPGWPCLIQLVHH